MDFPFVKEALTNLFSKTSCANYPAVPSPAAPNYRGKIKYDPTKCIACGMCERVCAGGAISRKIEKGADGEGDLVTLTFNMGSCTFCGHCADFCSRKAIELTDDYHMIATKEEDLLVTGSFRKAAPAKKPASAEAPKLSVKPRGDGKPTSDPNVCVYCSICAKKCPGQAIEVNRAEKLWKLDDEKCIACGACAENCPKKCIII